MLWLRAADGSGRKPAASRGTSATAFDVLRPLLHWCQRNRPGALPADLDIPYNPLPTRRSDQEPRRRLSSDQLKTILRACYGEIDEVWDRFQYGQEISPRSTYRRRPGMVRASLAGFGGSAASKAESCRITSPSRTTRHQGRHVARALGRLSRRVPALSHHDRQLGSILPAIAIQTAANPDPLRMIKRDCLVPHPLDEHRVIVRLGTSPRQDAISKKAQRRLVRSPPSPLRRPQPHQRWCWPGPSYRRPPRRRPDSAIDCCLTRSPSKDGARRITAWPHRSDRSFDSEEGRRSLQLRARTVGFDDVERHTTRTTLAA